MKEIDRLIRDALREEDAELFEKIGGEQRMHQVILDLFRGRNKWLSLATLVVTVLFLVLAVYAAIQFYRAEILRDMLLWFAVAAVCFMAIGAIKIWSWMEMAKNETMREIKRLELQVVHLATKLGRDKSQG